MKTIREITKKYVGLLPEGKKYITPEELEYGGFPDFIVERISIELAKNLADSIVPPTTDWANMETEPVDEAWQAFIEAIHAETRLPTSFAESVIEASVADVVDILTEPRKNLPDYIFGPDTELSRDELVERARGIVVYKHFANALIRFMEKKNLSSISKEKCAAIIAAVDEKLTSRYSSLNWAVLIDPWFELMGAELESDLLRRFFTDKKMHTMAARFDQEQNSVPRSRFIEIMSRPDLEGYEAEQDSAEAAGQNEQPVLTLASSLSDDEDSGEEPIISKFTKQDEEDEKSPSLADLKADEDSDGSDVPMWQRFMPDEEEAVEDVADEEPEADETDTELEPEPEYESEYEELAEPLDTEPIIDLTKSDAPDSKNQNLHKLLRDVDDQKEYFIQELFGDDENAFYLAMEEIAKFEEWRDTANYITKEIFRRNLVDLYSDVAVDFTDRLQNYFLEKEKD